MEEILQYKVIFSLTIKKINDRTKFKDGNKQQGRLMSTKKKKEKMAAHDVKLRLRK